MTRLVVAYDAERLGACYPAAVRLVALHERLGIPATWFLVGELLEREPEWKRLLDNPLFEIASHGYRHRLLRPSPNGDPAVSDAERWEELALGKDAVEQAFGRECIGFRPVNGYPHGLLGDYWLEDHIHDAGYRYVSSQLWGANYTPAPLEPPWPYSDRLWEMPAHFMHDTAFCNLYGTAGLSDQDVPLSGFYRGQLHEARKQGIPYVSFVWHPWALAELDSLDIVEAFTIWGRDLECSTFAAEYARVAQREEVAA